MKKKGGEEEEEEEEEGEDEDEAYNAVRMSSGNAEIDKLKYEHPLVDRYASKEMRRPSSSFHSFSHSLRI